MIYFLDFKASYTIYMIQNESRVSKLCSWSFKTMWGDNYPTLLETQNFMTPCYFGAPKLDCYRYGFFSRSGFESEPTDDMIFITLDDLYSWKQRARYRLWCDARSLSFNLRWINCNSLIASLCWSRSLSRSSNRFILPTISISIALFSSLPMPNSPFILVFWIRISNKFCIWSGHKYCQWSHRFFFDLSDLKISLPKTMKR